MRTLRDAYVVHSVSRNRNEARTEHRAVFHGDFHAAFRFWKEANARYRAGMFYWNANGKCSRLYASEDYLLDIDYP